MNKSIHSSKKIHFLIERFFIITGLVILTAVLLMGLYFNRYESHQKQEDNLLKIHSMLSQLIVPSLVISDVSEVRHLLFMAAGEKETFLVVDNSGTVIMSDYEKISFSNFASSVYKDIRTCKNLGMAYKYIDGKKYLINCSILQNDDIFNGQNEVGVLLSFSNYKWFSFSPIIIYFVTILMVLFLVMLILFRRMLYKQLLRPLVTLKDCISNISMEHALKKKHIEKIDNAPSELIEIKDVFERLILSLQGEYGRRVEAEKIKALILPHTCRH
ncbi:MAG: hypothetical protein WAW86_02775 [Gammaproteobacteria bacterium]